MGVPPNGCFIRGSPKMDDLTPISGNLLIEVSTIEGGAGIRNHPTVVRRSHNTDNTCQLGRSVLFLYTLRISICQRCCQWEC